MTGIKTLAVAGLLLAMMFSPSLSYPSMEGESGAMMKLEGIYCVINLVHCIHITGVPHFESDIDEQGAQKNQLAAVERKCKCRCI